jgi:hypothetical protein
LVACLGDPAVGGASGHIVFVQSDGGGEADVEIYGRFEKWLRDKLTAVDSLLVATGCIYALRRELARPLPAAALIDDAYLPLAPSLEATGSSLRGRPSLTITQPSWTWNFSGRSARRRAVSGGGQLSAAAEYLYAVPAAPP